MNPNNPDGVVRQDVQITKDEDVFEITIDFRLEPRPTHADDPVDNEHPLDAERNDAPPREHAPARYPIVITRTQLETAGACSNGLDTFLRFAPDGTLVIADAGAHVALLAGPLAEYETWAVRRGVLPPIRSTAGYCGTATAGYRGTATAGDDGTATAGDYGTATAGHGGTATAGDYGTATAGDGGTATAGHEGTLILRWWGDRTLRYRVAVAYVGEHAPGLPDGEVIQPDAPYRVEVVEGHPMWRRAEVTP